MTNQIGEHGEPVSDGFEYNSGRNDHFLDVAGDQGIQPHRSPMIPYGRQDISDEDIDAVTEVLRSDWLTQGQAGPAFRTGDGRLLRRAQRDCGLQCDGGAAHRLPRARPRPRRLALDHAEHLRRIGQLRTLLRRRRRLRRHRSAHLQHERRGARPRSSKPPRRAGRLPKIVVPVHFAGQSCEMREIRALADRYGFRIIEDASHAVGGDYLGRKVGSCDYGDTVSFQLPPGQDHHDRRGRHGADQRTEARRTPFLSAHARHHSSGTAARRVTRYCAYQRRTRQRGTRRPVDVRADRARPELSHDRHSVGARHQPARRGSTRLSRAVANWRRATTRFWQNCR